MAHRLVVAVFAALYQVVVAGHAGHMGVVPGRLHQNGAVGPAVLQKFQVKRPALRLGIGDAQHAAVAVLVEPVLRPGDDGGVVGVAYVWYDDQYHPALAPPEAPAPHVGLVAQPLNGLLHPRLGLMGHRGTAVDHSGNSSDRDARGFGDLRNRWGTHPVSPLM